MSRGGVISTVTSMSDLSGTRAWMLGPDNLSLDADDVHVWRSQLDLPAPITEWLASFLARDEQTRVQGLKHHHDRTEYIVARGLLRVILSNYLRKQPGELHFGYEDYGKPFLMCEPSDDSLSFNASHSGGIGLVAVTHRAKIGIDIECIRPRIAAMQMAELYFSDMEVRTLRSLPDDLRLAAFYRAWVRKEAYVKARGGGLSLDLQSFAVSLAPAEPAALLSVDGHLCDGSSWSLQDVEVGDGFAAAVAIQGKRGDLACWELRV